MRHKCLCTDISVCPEAPELGLQPCISLVGDLRLRFELAWLPLALLLVIDHLDLWSDTALQLSF